MTSNLRIVITGASSGIGRAVALKMAKGNTFFLTSRRIRELEEVGKEVRKLDGIAHIGTGDIRNPHQTNTLSQIAISKMGGVDVLFANAGVGYFGLLENITLEEYDSQFETNVRGVFLWIKNLLPHMKSQGHGQIIVTSSNLGLETSGRASIYSATKHAVQAMICSLREELKGTGVKVATINPGSVSTPWYDGKNADRSKMLTADDVATAVKYIIEQSKTSDIDHILIRPLR